MKPFRIPCLKVALFAVAVAAPLFSDPSGDSPAVQALAAAKAAHPGPVPPAAAAIVPVNPRFKQVRDKIAVLFHTDVALSPVTDLKSDPFRIGSGGTGPPASDDAAGPAAASPSQEPAAGSPEDQLKRFVSRLRIGGVSVLNGVARISIDGIPHRQNDFVKAGDPSNPVWLQVVRITPNSVTFRFRDNTEPDGPSFTLRM